MRIAHSILLHAYDFYFTSVKESKCICNHNGNRQFFCYGLFDLFVPHNKRDKEKMWWHKFLVIIMAICIVGNIVTYIIDFKNYQQKVTNLVFEDIELANIKDGTYQGEYNVGYIYAKVEVEIRNHKIVSINIVEHRNERGEPAEKIIDDMVVKQKIYVDAVSGATNSSNVIEKAVENALNGEN